MSVKTFTSEILTSSDTNTYLANSGLVYVTSATVGTGVATVTVTGAFSATYDNYKIIYTGATGGTGLISMTLGASTTTYSNTLLYGNSYGTPTPSGLGSNNSTNWSFVGFADANVCTFSVDLFSPFQTKYTSYGNGIYVSTSNAGTSSGVHATSASYTSFSLIAGSLTGVTITVYGYRKA